MALTVKDKLNLANANNLPAYLRKLADSSGRGFGDMLASLVPKPPRTRSGLTNTDEHEHDVATWIVDAYVTAGTPLAKVYGAAPGAGEVRIEYDATTGVPTLTFNAATTEYSVVEMGSVPQALVAALAEEV